jgi:hypothetical protein
MDCLSECRIAHARAACTTVEFSSASSVLAIAPRHRGGNTAFVQENRAFRRDRIDASYKLLALFTICLGISPAGMERLFLRRRPSFRINSQTCVKRSETPAWLRSFSRASAKVG